MRRRILYAGDSPAGGAANYLLGVLNSMKAQVRHLAPEQKLEPASLNIRYDVIILSDFSSRQVSSQSQAAILEQVQDGTGLVMIGGWGSFSGPFGGWRGSRLEKALPVSCKASDDRINFPGGAALLLKENGLFLNAKMFRQVPAICGINEFSPKAKSKTLVSVRRILSDGHSIRLEKREYPLLVVGTHPTKRVAALATDLAPHWCGGLVDWGNKTLKLHARPNIQIQVGNYYVEFVSSLLRWLAPSQP